MITFLFIILETYVSCLQLARSMTTELCVLSLNIWGVRYISKCIDQRIQAFIEHLLDPQTKYDIIGLQEVNIINKNKQIDNYHCSIHFLSGLE